MKKKTSITVDEAVLQELEQYAGVGGSRSAYIEHVLRAHLRKRKRAAEQESDILRINAGAARLNSEMAEVLKFQTWPTDD